jgi:hypothetical protein
MMRTMALVAALVLLAGCGNAEPSSDSAGHSKDDEPSVELAGELIFEVSGGFAGIHERLVIRPDGHASFSAGGEDEQEFRLSDPQIQALALALDSADFDNLPAESTSGTMDAFWYSLQYRGKTVEADEDAIPPALQPLIDELRRIGEAHHPARGAGS